MYLIVYTHGCRLISVEDIRNYLSHIIYILIFDMASNIMQSTNFYANNARFRRISNASNFLSSSTNISIYALSDPNNIVREREREGGE